MNYTRFTHWLHNYYGRSANRRFGIPTPPIAIVTPKRVDTVYLLSRLCACRSSANSADRPSGRPKTSADSGGGRADDDELAATAASSCWALSPGEAWAGSDQSVFVPRPLSAGPFHRPVLRAEFISSEASLSPQDPAVPLIKAIRKELDKLPTPNPHHGDSSR